jgi:hypothetical protein
MLAYRTNPTMPKKIHAADSTDRAKIASATGYTTSFFLGSGKWDKHPSPTLERAREVARQMLADPEYAKSGRKPIIYAHLPDGTEVVVPDDYEADDGLDIPAFLDRRPGAAAAQSGGPLPKGGRGERAQARTPAPEAGKAAADVQMPDSVVQLLNMPTGIDGVAFHATEANVGPMTVGGRPVHKANRPLQAGDLVAGQVVVADLSDVIDPLKVFVGAKRILARHLDMLESAQAGVLPKPPAATAATWNGNTYRGRLERLVAMVEAGDIAGLEAKKMPDYDSGFIAMGRYRNLAVIALRARAKHREQKS